MKFLPQAHDAKCIDIQSRRIFQRTAVSLFRVVSIPRTYFHFGIIILMISFAFKGWHIAVTICIKATDGY